MDADGRNGNKRFHQRLAPPDRANNKVCYHWRAGRCNRHPCPFLHSELPPHQQQQSAAPDGGAVAKRNNVWRNPGTAGAASGPPSKWGKGRGGGVVGRPPGRASDRICHYFLAGNCTYGENCRFLHSWFISDSFSLLTPLQGHQKGCLQAVSGIALPSGSDKLYSGSMDESVRAWDCQTGQCVGVINMGGEIGCMISEGPWLFIGVRNAVKAWNTQTATELSLDGPSGQVYSLVVGNELLFAGTQNGRILAWKFSAVGNCFEPAAFFDGHRLSVVSLVVGAMRLYSSSMDNTIRVWDLVTFQCIQTLTDHTSVVMSVLCWDQFLLSCSLDKTIKVWVTTESGNLEVTYTHTEEHIEVFCCYCNFHKTTYLFYILGKGFFSHSFGWWIILFLAYICTF
ncbi:zinc finger CCCH domain-containing protein [Musa troglodytarum]|uniref:Zinc finger CCCH domain-containing protein n=1 Tax=Musa troglodytarum TaxID=320322 RepID=A0A9E7JNQ2_9LILI|nr:zinc finger CCCH domain-containing protein [Musa troglodytarum]